jgi:hypothetical protein
VAQLLRAEPDRRPHPYVVRSAYFHPPCPDRKVALSGEFVWALETDVKRVVCELHDHGADGWDAQLVRDGEFSANRRFDTRAQALAHADAMRVLLEGGGWKLVAA